MLETVHGINSTNLWYKIILALQVWGGEPGDGPGIVGWSRHV